MPTEVRVPALGESVTEATVATWFKKVGDTVAVDEMLCELETDKVTVEVPAKVGGVLAEIVAKEGETVGVDALLATIDDLIGKGPDTGPAVMEPVMAGAELASEVSTPQTYVVPAEGTKRFTVAAIDLGIKAMTPQRLSERGLDVHVLTVLEHIVEGVTLGCGLFIAEADGGVDIGKREVIQQHHIRVQREHLLELV